MEPISMGRVRLPPSLNLRNLSCPILFFFFFFFFLVEPFNFFCFVYF